MGQEFVDADLAGARFVRCILAGAVVRAADLTDLQLDGYCDGTLLVEGVDVMPYVEAELDRRFPGRAGRLATTPDGLRQAWVDVRAAWAEAVRRVASMPAGTHDESVDGEWSFAQTLRHLVTATDIWLRGAVLGVDQPLHPLGQPHAEYATDGYDMSVFAPGTPPYDDVLAVRAERQAMLTDVLQSITAERLEERCPNPWSSDPARRMTVGACLRVILNEEWAHLRYALRDLDVLATR